MSNSKLDETLDLEEMEKIHDELTINLPSEPTLNDVAKIALKSYKQQIEDMIHIEPKNRQRHLEVACQYLNVAREAIKQDEELRIKENKEKGVYKSQEQEVPEGKNSRQDLMNRVKSIK